MTFFTGWKRLKRHIWVLGQKTKDAWKPWRGLLNDPILVYSPGKVGSTSVEVTLERLRLPNPIFHIHFMDWDYLKEVEEYLQQFSPDYSGHISTGKGLRFFADRTWGKVRWKLITLVREPIGREISDLFENLRTFPDLRELHGDALAEAAIRHMQELFAAFDASTDYAENWFDRELKKVFGFDLYAAPFDPSQGYAIYTAQHADLLLLRLEDLSRVGEQALGEFLGLKNVHLVNANQGKQKPYQQAYRQVVDKLRFSVTTLEAIYNTRYTHHFYSSAEIETFKEHWGR